MAGFSFFSFSMVQGSGMLPLALPDTYYLTAVAGGLTDPVAFTSVLLNDPDGAVTVTPIAATTPGSLGLGETFELTSDGTGTFTPGEAFAGLLLGSTAVTHVSYTNNLGGTANLSYVVSGSLTLAYGLDVADGGGVAGDATGSISGASVTLTGDAFNIVATASAGVSRTGGTAGTAFLTFADDAARIEYTFTETNPLDYFASALEIDPTGASGVITETTAAAGGFSLQITGTDLVASIADGTTTLTVTRDITSQIAAAERFTVAVSMGSAGLQLAVEGDVAGGVTAAPVGAYVAPIGVILRVGGAAADIYGATLWSPSNHDAAGLVATMNALTVLLAGIPVVDEASSTNVTFLNITDDGVKFRLATILASGSLVTTSAGRVEVEAFGGGGSGAGTHGGQPGGGGGAGEYLRAFVDLAAATHSITIGAGTVSPNIGGVAGERGASTTLFSLTALGGGGGMRSMLAPVPAKADGGSGGGMGAAGVDPWIGLSIASDGVGFNGGFGQGGYRHSGGGGGASQAGAWSSIGAGPVDEGGKGGDGVTSTFSGVSLALGGGGGGGVNEEPAAGVVPGAGGLGGGGVGGAGGDPATATAAGSGVVNTGGGGGGSGKSSVAAGGGSGGSGVARVRWPFEWVYQYVDENESSGATFSDTTDGGVDYRVAVFATGAGSLVVAGGVDVEYLMLGGGGAGGSSTFEAGPGGGAGGHLTNVGGAAASLNAGAYSITVGAGAAASTDGAAPLNGAPTTFNGLTAVGGSGSGNRIAAEAGGGSSGGNGRSVMGAATAATAGQGNVGGRWSDDGSTNGPSNIAGGGGGAGGVGGSANVRPDGGPGVSSTITGSAVTYGGGGGGAAQTTQGIAGVGGSGGGGDGAANTDSPSVGSPGEDGKGGGGGGGYRFYDDPAQIGGKGGDGVLIVRWVR
jgi:hypothetical protein